MKDILSRLPKNRFYPVLLLIAVSIALSTLTRLIIFIAFHQTIEPTITETISAFIIGFLYDTVAAMGAAILLLLHIGITNNSIYSSRGKWWVIGGTIVLLSILFFTRIVPKDFSPAIYTLLEIYIILRLFIYLFLYRRSAGFRTKWRSVIISAILFLLIAALMINAVSEYFFWNEFGSRYNFIAVDYLVYTNEVLGNIRESYPIVPIFSGLFLLAAVLVAHQFRSIRKSVSNPMHASPKLAFTAGGIAIAILLSIMVNPQWQQFGKNVYANELAGNGTVDFVQAFKNKELDFDAYYQHLPDSTAFKIVRAGMSEGGANFVTDNPMDLRRNIDYAGTEQKMNVVLISVESLSADFLGVFGNTKSLTPQLDSVARNGWLFTGLYASGTRTVRGLEALSLSIPPLPGESIVKRPENEDLFSLGSVFKSKGYTTQFLYGGYSYFDNMQYFFQNNGYDVIDRNAIPASDVHYQNIWGVADEDLFQLAIGTMDANYKMNKPFFTQVMTVSNHRPYTYPANRIDISPETKSRSGAVKYTDYAIGKFLKEAAGKPWFRNTLFVIVADHCAASSGKQALPLKGYQIPLIFYAPGMLKPKEISSLMAQIDIAPTILGMLQMDYQSKFFGQDLFSTPASDRRAFISTYQGLGMLKGDTLIVQSPLKKMEAYKCDPLTGEETKINASAETIRETIAWYQTADRVFRNKNYKAEN